MNGCIICNCILVLVININFVYYSNKQVEAAPFNEIGSNEGIYDYIFKLIEPTLHHEETKTTDQFTHFVPYNTVTPAVTPPKRKRVYIPKTEKKKLYKKKKNKDKKKAKTKESEDRNKEMTEQIKKEEINNVSNKPNKIEEDIKKNVSKEVEKINVKTKMFEKILQEKSTLSGESTAVNTGKPVDIIVHIEMTE